MAQQTVRIAFSTRLLSISMRTVLQKAERHCDVRSRKAPCPCRFGVPTYPLYLPGELCFRPVVCKSVAAYRFQSFTRQFTTDVLTGESFNHSKENSERCSLAHRRSLAGFRFAYRMGAKLAAPPAGSTQSPKGHASFTTRQKIGESPLERHPRFPPRQKPQRSVWN
jgi:hypothetical protein